MPAPTSERNIQQVRAVEIHLSGRVQGLGVRPCIARLAAELRLSGTVANSREGVAIVVEGSPERIELMRQRLPGSLPAQAVVESIRVFETVPSERRQFVIEQQSSTGEPLQTQVPGDLAVCQDCLSDVSCAENRRAGYSFTSCTACGPRYSLIDAMPYERAQTGMAGFRLCPICRQEWTDPADRRFHAQTNACPNCGPQLWCRDGKGRIHGRGDEALRSAVAAVQGGEIVAVRGLGGYQLVVDATNARAVERLRNRKHRPGKPFAVMAASTAEAAQLACLDDAERRLLAGSDNTIVLLRARSTGGLAPGIHPGLHTVGVMLPTTPLHWQLLQGVGRPLVVTSGNREGEPLAVGIEESERRLSQIADLWLHHDRPIPNPVDDSVTRIVAGRRTTIRCARGLAPLALDVPHLEHGLAVGAQQKCAVSLCNGVQAVLGPHIGDMDTASTRTRFVEHVERFCALYGAQPKFVAHDLHPDYFTTRWAQERSWRRIAVQHHHAHVVAGMLECGWLDRSVLGVAFDGTGFGNDGTVWGGEILLASTCSFQRIAHLRSFRLAGGEAAIRQPWRVAAALIRQIHSASDTSRVLSELFSAEVLPQLLAIIDDGRFSPTTTSAGRLFDGIAAMIVGSEIAEFEGQPAMLLEAVCDPQANGAYHFHLQGSGPTVIDWRPVVRQLLADRAAGVAPGTMAMRFHRGLAKAVVCVCRESGHLPVVISGGCFQNQILTELIADGLTAAGQLVGRPGVIPTNDGGLAAGQLTVALARVAREGGR